MAKKCNKFPTLRGRIANRSVFFTCCPSVFGHDCRLETIVSWALKQIREVSILYRDFQQTLRQRGIIHGIMKFYTMHNKEHNNFPTLENTPFRTGSLYNVARGTFTFLRQR